MLASHVNFRSAHKPCRVEFVGIHPHDGVSLQSINVNKHLRSGLHLEAEKLVEIVRGFVRERERRWWMEPEKLLHHCL